MAQHDKQYEELDNSDDSSGQYSHESDSDGEVALDLNGCKHVERRNNADGVYWSQGSSQSVYTVFPMPGKASADALRKFLSSHLRPELITDEYGMVTSIDDITDDYLLVLQAKLWEETLIKHDDMTSKPAISQDTVQISRPCAKRQLGEKETHHQWRTSHEDDTFLAGHVMNIIELLASNYIFVLRTGNTDACRLMVCRNACANDTSPSYVVALEPLIHWGTVTPATEVPLAHGRILAFLRNSERCDDPLWTMAIQAFMPEHRMIYCSNCLEILIERRQEGFVPIKECKMNGFMPVNSHQVNQTTANRRVLGRWHTGMAESEARRSMTSGSELFEGYENENEKASMAALQLDGVIESVTPDKHSQPGSPAGTPSLRRSARCSAKRIISSLGDVTSPPGRRESSSSKGSSYRRRYAFTPPSTMSVDGSSTPSEHSDSFPWALIDNSPSTPTKLLRVSTVIYSKTQPLSPSQANKPKPLDILRSPKSIDTLRNPGNNRSSSKRSFGQEIDLNIRGPLRSTLNIKDKMSGKDATAKGTADIRSFFSSTPAPLPEWAERALQKAKVHTQSFRPEVSSTDHDSIMSDLTSADSSTIEDLKRATECDPDPQKLPGILRKIKPLPKKSSPTRLKTGKQNVEPAKSKDQAPFAPLYAKHALAPIDPSEVLEEVSIYTYTDHVKRVPAANDKICSCHRAARTPHIKVAQCANKECFIGWYHYDCLDKSAKISARFGTMVCQHCRNEKEFKEMGEKNKFNIDEVMVKEMGVEFNWTKDGILAALPGPGGHVGVKNPYGLGDVGPEASTVSAASAQDALGSLAYFGLKESRPYLLNEAYNNAQVHIVTADARFEEQQEVEDEEYNEEEQEDEYDEEADESMDIDESMNIDE